jgi:HD-GYP domain-containing protein (c-di-GMP phosphodiesterase class II)
MPRGGRKVNGNLQGASGNRVSTPAAWVYARGIMESVHDEVHRLRQRERQLVEITSMLSVVTDTTTLLEKIMTSLRLATLSDAGSLYIVEGESTLRFSVAQNDSRDIPFKAFTLPISPNTIAGYVAQSGEILCFDDVYAINNERPFQFKADFDRQFGYRTRSMLCVPMRNQQQKIVGVVQLINKKRAVEDRIREVADADRVVLSYTPNDIEFLEILASQAAIIIERAALYEGIERLLRGFVESSAASIESRDKITAGHSQRIAAYIVAMAKRINKQTEGFWKDITYSNEEIRELFYAAMLHDIGKIGVREHVLMKENKLTNDRMEMIRLRIEVGIMQDREHEAEWREIWEFLKGVNIPGFLDDDRFNRLQEIAKREVIDSQGVAHPLLDAFELENLSVRRGNLTDAERKEIESHVVHSAEILQVIPWTDNLKRVPVIAGSHHEKLNGKGYPQGLTKDEIPFEGRMLAVLDVFEALTAMDRPYKPAMPIAKAIEILRAEAKFGGLQSEIVEFFVQEKIHDVIPEDQRRHFTLTSEEILALE